MTVIAHTDGASRGNPGASGIGVILRTPEGTVLGTASGYLGVATNNMAEYTALLACLRAAAQLPCDRLIVHTDSELMVRQIQGTYKVRDKDLRQLVDEVRRLLKGASFEFTIVHVSREKNREADLLANAGIDSALAKRR